MTSMKLVLKCDVPNCTAGSPAVVIHSVERFKDYKTWKLWEHAIGSSVKDKTIIYACQRHFPAGGPTKNYPFPNPNLFNPIPVETSGIWTSDKYLNFNNKLLNLLEKVESNHSVCKLSPNATLIDLKKIKERNTVNMEEVMVVIDDTDKVQVIDFESDKTLHNDYSTITTNKDSQLALQSNAFSSNEEQLKDENSDLAPSFYEFSEFSLGNTLEQMRLLKIDCDVVLVDLRRKHTVYAHQLILIARSPYLYKQLYLHRKKKNKKVVQIILPLVDDFEAVEAVVSYIYTGALSFLIGRKTKSIKKVLTLFELTEALELFQQEFSFDVQDDEKLEEISNNARNFDISSQHLSQNRSFFIHKKQKSKTLGLLSSNAKYKSYINGIVENALNPFLDKIDELFHSGTSTLQMLFVSQRIITLWLPDILLTKLFDQNDLSKYFSDVIAKELKCHRQFSNTIENDSLSKELKDVMAEVLTLKTISDDLYNKASEGQELLLNPTIETVTLGDMQLINFANLDSKYIPYFVHIIAFHRFTIKLYKQKNNNVEQDDCHKEHTIDSSILGEFGEYRSLLPVESIKSLINQLRRKVIKDLELNVNISYHEELIMYILMDQIDNENLLLLNIAVFLSKGCQFCQKQNCKAENLTVPLTPNTPVCPDRQCIRRNLFCDICNKQLTSSKALARHKYSLHSNEENNLGKFICSHCGDTFAKKWKLNIHEKQHEDKKVETVCPYCRKIIRGEMALRKHINMVHKTKKRFVCEVCHKAYKRKVTLAVHMRIHTGEKPFSCSHCDYASETKGNLKAHFQRKHKFDSTVTLQTTPLTGSVEDAPLLVTEDNIN